MFVPLAVLIIASSLLVRELYAKRAMKSTLRRRKGKGVAKFTTVGCGAYERRVQEVHRTLTRDGGSTHAKIFCNQAQNY